MTTSKRTLAVALLLAFIAAACGGGGGTPPSAEPSASGGFNEPFTDAEAYPVIASSEIVVGENRLLVGLLSDEDAPIANPDISMSIDFFQLEHSTTHALASEELDFIWTIEPYVGLYVADVKFIEPGEWGAEVTATGTDFDGNEIDVTVKTSFEVKPEGTTPSIGEPAPKVDTPTAADVGKLSEISTDPKPNPRFYEMSIAQAVSSGNPSVIVFSTPKYCESQVCGPTLEVVKSVAGDFRTVNFVHVEPYDLEDPTALEVVPAVNEYGLPSEPWVFVVDAKGKVAAKFEGGLAAKELSAALEKV
jgi:hypothetical protein